jgi:hypothetical protein
VPTIPGTGELDVKTATKNPTLLSISASVVALALAMSGCDDSATKPQQSPSPSASNSSEAITPPTTTPAKPDGTITLEVNGSGDVYAIWSDPFGDLAKDHATLPFSKSFPLSADTMSVSVNWTSRDDNPKGCKITWNDKVVTEKPPSPGDGQCVWQR